MATRRTLVRVAGLALSLPLSMLNALQSAADTASQSERSEHASMQSTEWPILELRQYTLHPGKRDTLIDLFEREFVESQEAVGMSLIGQFRDLDDADRFVWLRAFRDMPSRAESLQSFYAGPVWKEHRNAANSTMIDSDNVLLLHAATPSSGFPATNELRAAPGTTGPGRGLIGATIYYFDQGRERDFVAYFEREVQPLLREADIEVRASFVSEATPNSFPPLPVRDRDFVFVWFATFGDEAERASRFERLHRLPQWPAVERRLQTWFERPAESLRLEPTARSRLQD